MNEECLVCGAPLEYFGQEEELVCVLCGKKERAAVRCRAGHYVCNACHTGGLDAMAGICLRETRKDPWAILETLMAQPFCHMHGPEHHVLVGAALLTAYSNAGGKLSLEDALRVMIERGSKVPGGICGYWGCCGAAVSTGIFAAIATGSTPLKQEEWGLSNRMTAAALGAIGAVGGPRCCKRDSALAVTEAVKFARTHLGVSMTAPSVRCAYSGKNNQCIKGRCPFYTER